MDNRDGREGLSMKLGEGVKNAENWTLEQVLKVSIYSVNMYDDNTGYLYEVNS